jgi:transcriptional regulator with XRE-family HTH domain
MATLTSRPRQAPGPGDAGRTAASRRDGGRSPRKARAQDVDRQVGARIRERRVMLGLTQQQVGELIGVTYQQAHKYEKGVNRVSAGRLHQVARALGVGVDHFYGGLGGGGGGRGRAFEPTPPQRMLLDLARNVSGIPDPRLRGAVCDLARALATAEPTAADGAPAAAWRAGLVAASRAT